MSKYYLAQRVRVVLGSFFVFGLFFLSHMASAGTTPGIFSSTGTTIKTFSGVPAGSSVAVGDVDNDGTDEIVVGSEPGTRVYVKIYEKDGTLVRTILPYSSAVSVGVNVAIGDFYKKNRNDIAVSLRRGAAPHVTMYTGSGNRIGQGFFAYDPKWGGGVNIATGDVTGDGIDEIITGAGPGGGPHVMCFTYIGERKCNFMAYELGFTGGVNVDALDYNGDEKEEVVTTPQTNRVVDIKITRTSNKTVLKTVRAFGTFAGGASVASNTSGGGKRVIVGAGPGGGPHVLQYNLLDGTVNALNKFPFDLTWHGGVTADFVTYDGGVQYFAIPGSTTLSKDQLISFGATVSTGDTGVSNSAFERKSVATSVGTFTVNVVRVNLKNSKLKVKSITGSSKDCNNVPCVTRSLQSYVDQVGGFAGINGSYFCPADYASCASYPGSFYWLWYNSLTGIFSNSYQNQFNQGPVIAFNTANKMYYYRIAKDWPGKASFESSTGTKLAAAISNGPELVYEGVLTVTADKLDDKQRTVKSNRSGIGFIGDNAYLVAASGATVLDLGHVMKALGMKFAVNLDGGGSTAIIYDGQYRIGPGRNIPNALVFTEI